ncbi:acyltransferase family protein [Bdellovibrio bacteriovorus]|uniref:acyltransferase family protein n=1 Tax=Bdellovibrio bacteriovorus TaxID=959 RepID=UPI003AA86B86
MSSVIRYRPEIDGLRAIAVVAVIVFHLNAQWLPGGFAGVDVFFALSGFLITSIIVREKESGIFSFKSFYIRRMKRILPPLYALVAATVLLGVLVLTPKDFRYFKESIKYLLMFCSNVYFGKGGDYFGPQSAEMPLLHTWSLAVEEQFYFFWPVLFGLSYKIRNGWKKSLFVVLVICSFVYGEYLLQIKSNKPLAYYSLFSRYGEMLLGAGVAILMVNKDSPLNGLGRYLSNLSCLLGIVMLLGSFVLLGESVRFPGVNALPSVVGTLLLIVGMTNYQGVVVAVLSSPLFSHLGKISYSLYLWHWPILAYMRYMFGARDLPVTWIFVAVFLTYVCSVFSYYTVEQSVRNLKMSFANTLASCLVVPTIVIVVALRGAEYLSLQNDVSPLLSTYGGEEVCHFKFGENCIRGDISKKPGILIFGDSHAAHLHYFMDKLGHLNGWSAMMVSASSCGPALGFDVDYLPVGSRKDCQELLSYVQNNIAKYDTIVIAARWDFQFGIEPSEYNDPDFTNKFEKTLEALKKAGKRVLVVSQIPALTSDPFRMDKVRKLGVPVEVKHGPYTGRANTVLRQMALQHDVEVMDIASLTKDLDGGFYLNGNTVYMDNNHLNQLGSAALAEKYFKGENLLK